MTFLSALRELWDNRILISAMSAWAAAQIIKTFLYAAMNGSIDWHRLTGDGGMPSGHSAAVTAAAVVAAIRCGFGSAEFAILALLASIVMHDACGVRRETGKQAAVIQDIVHALNLLAEKTYTPPQKLKLFVGHTPLQVFCGCLLGIFVGILFGVL